MKTTISIEIDTERLGGFTDAYLAQLWHIAQANPVNGFTSREPGDLAEAIGREIIRRFLAEAPPELWHHQGRHFEWAQARRDSFMPPPPPPSEPEAQA